MKVKRHIRQLSKFFSVQMLGTVIDYGVALASHIIFAVSAVAASTVGFFIGSAVNYFAHSNFTFNDGARETASLFGFGKYLLAVATSLLVRIIVIAALETLTLFPFWFILFLAFGASFISSYVVSAVWVFKK